MNIKYNIVSFFLLFTFSVFSQETNESKEIMKQETKLSYLDSIKKTFVKDDIATCVDSLWLKELADLDIYKDITNDIITTNTDEKVDFELPTELLKSRLAAMDAKSPFNIEYNPGLENLIKSFLKNRKKAFSRLMATSEYYFPIFEEALAKQNIPLEIKYLAVVESALNPKAVSRVGATGLWQFMYHTGKQYKLNIDSYVDDRSDPLKSSEAAAHYMSNMYGIFGDWDLVLASYNSGPGNVSKAIRRSGGQQNFWNIKKHLPRETQGYVPAFLATMYIYEYHKEHGIKPERAVLQHFATDTVNIKKQISFKQISALIDIPVVELQLLNPSYKLNVIPVYAEHTNYLKLPQDKIAVFTSNEDKIYAYVQHELDNREKTYSTPKAVAVLDTVNYSQERITIPKTKYYKVKSGDNLTEIADKYDVTIAELKKWNNIKNNSVSKGKSLKIITSESIVRNVKKSPKKDVVIPEIVPENQTTAVAVLKENENKKNTSLPTENPATYVVQKGDNLWNIAKKFSVTVQDLNQWNTILNNSVVIGSTLNVAKGETIAVANNNIDAYKKTPIASQKGLTEYFVQKGDSLYSISKKYPGVTIADIQKWNGIKAADLKPGMKLKISG